MELSIDFKFLSSIAFNDAGLMNELAEEWCEDTSHKMKEIKEGQKHLNIDQLFNRIHELKTNFTMVQSPEAIQYIGTVLNHIEQTKTLPEEATLKLDEISGILIRLIKSELQQNIH